MSFARSLALHDSSIRFCGHVHKPPNLPSHGEEEEDDEIAVDVKNE